LSVTCPNGHISSTADYCDQCGAPIGAAATPPASGGGAPSGAPPADPSAPPSAPPPKETPDAAPSGDELETYPPARQHPCPQCGAPRTGDDRYCEGCGYDFVAAPAPVASESVSGPAPTPDWEVVASADRQQFDRLAPARLEFPARYPERHFALTGNEVSIGRTHPPEQPPDINLAGTLEDPAVSHRHAVLERQGDRSYKLRDLGSTNGTTLNDDPTPISGDTGAPVADGDRIHLGAWTTLTVRRKG
jgi:hypothetical protein